MSICGVKVILHVLNVVTAVLGVAIAATSTWLIVQVHAFVALRNRNHYLLDYTVYWPQVVPWIFFIVSIFVLCISCCGFMSSRKNNRNFNIVYAIFLGVIVICLLTAAIVAFVLADDRSTGEFVKDISWDVYSRMKTDSEVAEAFETIERKLHCCGISSPRDYKSWRGEFPMSCCDGYNHGWLEPFSVDCKFSNQLANKRHGCVDVASHYASVVIKVLSSASIFTAVIVVTSLVVTLLQFPGL